MTVMNVAFDLDGTLIAIDSAQSWLSFVQQLQLPYAIEALTECEAILQAYDTGAMDMAAYMHSWLKPLQGMSADKAEHLAECFLHEVVMPQIYPEAIDRLRVHQQRNDRIMLISASPDIIIRPIARYLGISSVIGIRTEIIDNTITGTAIPPFSFKEGKVTAINEWLKQINQSGLQLAYSDSWNDLPMLEQAENACCINPSALLHHHAQTKGWEICQWQTGRMKEKIS